MAIKDNLSYQDQSLVVILHEHIYLSTRIYDLVLIYLMYISLECPSGWVDGGKLGCYYIATKASKMTYAKAKTYCKSLDPRAHLIEIRAWEIQRFIEGLKDIKTTKWWLGATDQTKVV